MQEITVSIVSHNHSQLIDVLVYQLSKFPQHIAKIIITNNTNDICLIGEHYPFEVTQIHNKNPKGFGANHNQAFRHCETDYFCVMNPDISIVSDPFSVLLSCFADHSVAIIAPLIVNLRGTVEDSARFFPTPWGLVKKVFGHYNGVYHIKTDQELSFPDWVAGMFLLIKSVKYTELAGFDESFFLYYEDVDLCARAWQKDYVVALCREVYVIHDARRSSHRDLKFFKWHVMSALRFFMKHLCRLSKRKYIEVSF